MLDGTERPGYRAFQSVLERMANGPTALEAQQASPVVLRLCQRLYNSARSFDALPFARANVSMAAHTGDVVDVRRAHTACGLLLADTADIIGAVEHHMAALKIAVHAGNAEDISRIWNNIGLAFVVSGHFGLAVTCFKRVLALVEPLPGPVYSRYTAFINLAHCLYHLDQAEEGVRFARRALGELTAGFAAQDPHGVLLLHRNCVRLYVALGRLDDARVHVDQALAMSAKAGTPRAAIAAGTTQAAYELACGEDDIGLTRLDKALVLARSVPATLRDTLVSVIRAEEKAGFPANALVRLRELSDHIYRTSIGQIRQHIELADALGGSMPPADKALEQARVRLTARLAPPVEPPEWKTLQRLAAGAAFRIDPTSMHGTRVGALAKALALEYGCSPIESLEFGLAAQIHDIGMASVPEKILAKPGPLNDVERSLVEKHTEAGAEILAGDSHARVMVARDVAKYHHADWDGGGYPAKVSGQAIPLSARICAVADAYDSMATDRPYQAARSMSDAMHEMRLMSGSRLDPELVRCFELVIRRESANEGIDPSLDVGLESFQQLVFALSEDRGFL